MSYDFHTKNESFLRQYKYLRKKGIKNNKFFLVINNKNLIGIDPHDSNLSNNIKAQIIKECMDNYWYFIREVVRIPYMGGGNNRYQLNKGNLAFNFCVLKDLNIFFEIPVVPNGKTTSVLSRLLWENVFVYNFYEYRATLMNKKSEDARTNLYKLNDMFDALPEYIKCVFNRNQINVLPTPRTEVAVNAIARGLESSRIYLDNFAFMKNNYELYIRMMPAFRVHNINCKNNGTPTGIIITTIPGHLETKEGSAAYDFERYCYQFSEILYDMSDENINEAIRYNSSNDFILIKYNYKELGLDEQWFKHQSAYFNYDLSTINRELLLKWKPDEL